MASDCSMMLNDVIGSKGHTMICHHKDATQRRVIFSPATAFAPDICAQWCIQQICRLTIEEFLFLSLSYSICPVFLFFSCSFSHPAFSSMVPLCKPGPAGGFFLLKGSFSLPPVLTWEFRLWASASVKHLETISIVKGAMGKKQKRRRI